MLLDFHVQCPIKETKANSVDANQRAPDHVFTKKMKIRIRIRIKLIISHNLLKHYLNVLKVALLGVTPVRFASGVVVRK